MRIIVPAFVHDLLEILAFLAGFRYYVFLRRRKGDSIPELNRTWIIIGAVAGALIGSRLVGIFEDPQCIQLHSFRDFVLLFGSKSIAGGLFGGTLGVEIVKKIIGEKQRSGDLFVFPILLALIIGRTGCLLTALSDHTAGSASALPWAIDYGDGIPRHPLPLYEILFLTALFGILRYPDRRSLLVPGALFKIMMCAYFTYRFGNELLKDDYIYSWGLTAIQTCCVLVLVYYYETVFFPRRLLKKYA